MKTNQKPTLKDQNTTKGLILKNKFNSLYTGFNIRLDIKYPLRPLIFFLKKLKSQK